jgi:hypothetical protein
MDEAKKEWVVCYVDNVILSPFSILRPSPLLFFFNLEFYTTTTMIVKLLVPPILMRLNLVGATWRSGGRCGGSVVREYEGGVPKQHVREKMSPLLIFYRRAVQAVENNPLFLAARSKPP